MALEINKTIPGLNLFPPAENKCSAAACNIGCPAPIKFFSSKTRSSRSFSTGCNSSVTVFIFTSPNILKNHASLRRLTKVIFLLISNQFVNLRENSSIFPVAKNSTLSYLLLLLFFLTG